MTLLFIGAEPVPVLCERNKPEKRKVGEMNEDVFNMSIRKFLKKVGVTSQREIEHAVHKALADGRIAGGATLKARVTLTVDGIDLSVPIEGDIELE